MIGGPLLMAAAVTRLLLLLALAGGSTALWLGFLNSGPPVGDPASAILRVAAQSVFAPASTARAGAPAGFGEDVTANACRGCTLRLSAGGGVRARVATGSLRRHAYAVLDLGSRAIDGQIATHDVIGLGLGETPVTVVHLLQMSDAMHRVIFELVADPQRQLRLYSPAGGLRNRPLDIATGATVPNDGISGVAVDIVRVRNGVSVYVNGVRTIRLTGLSGATTSAPRYLAAGVVRYSAPPNAAPLTAVHAQVSVSNDTTPSVSTARPPAPTSAPPSPPATNRVALASTSPPTISGESVPGSTLSADAGTWTDPSATFKYSWQRCDASGACTAIDGATRAQYTLTTDDAGKYIRVRVTATSATATTAVVSAAVGPVAPAAPVATAAPVIIGDAAVGSTLNAKPGTWSDPAATLSYNWRRCDATGACTTIDGASSATYTLTSDDLGDTITVSVTATNAGGQNTATSPATAPIGPATSSAPSDTTAPSISGEAVVGSTLTAGPGSWSDPSATFSYAWRRCDATGACTTIDGASSATYTLTSDDLGDTITVSVTATNAGGQNTATSPATAPIGPATSSAPSDTTAPSISGEAVVGSTLTAGPGSWSDPSATFSYAWRRCDATGACTTIDGASSATYTLTSDDLGDTITVSVTATNAGGQNTATSPATAPIGPATSSAPSDTTAPSISGEAVVGSTLTAGPGSWSDPSATFSYAWQRCDATGACTTIDGASSATYTLTSDDLGDTITVSVTATNAGGQNTATSPATAPIGPATSSAPSDTTAPSISGEAVVGSTLTAGPGSWSDPSATFSYAWRRCDATGACTTIDGASSATYTLTSDDLGDTITVSVTATNAGGQNTATSPATAPIGPATSSAPSDTTAPSISGEAVVGSTLTAGPGSWSDPSATFSYAWQPL